MLLPIKKINERLESSIEDSDTAYFLDLMLAGEQLTKIVTACLVACINDDSKRHRYSQEYSLIRADGIGDWSKVIEEILTGTTSQFFNPVANNLQRELVERLGIGSWQYDCIDELMKCIKIIEGNVESIPVKISGKTWFSYFAFLRNKTRGHGALQSDVYTRLCPHLAKSIELFIKNYSLLNQFECAFLYRNLRGNYRVSDITPTTTKFHYLKTERNLSFENGVYMFLNKPTKLELIYTNSDLQDFYFPNGGFNNKKYEVISYITGNKDIKEADSFLTPPGDLPSSETEGLGKLELVGKVFTNLPTPIQGYIKRPTLELELHNKLIDERHPIITLTGRGGIGKTSLAINVLNQLCSEERFNAIIWFSARDIDLLMEGAKPVKPHVLTSDDISKEFVKLVEPIESKEKGFKPKTFLEKEFGQSSIGPILYIFDNFETVKDPIDLFQWLDTFIRTPNKILITSRFRDFKADYPIEVSGMNENEFSQLVEKTAKNLGITDLIESQDYLDELYNESDGHPYVVKVLLGEVAKEGKIGKVKRIVAGKDEILTALFERTYSGLTPAAKRIFLTLSNWKSNVPEIGIEAILMRESNEQMDVEKAIEELYRSSLINIEKSEKDGMRFISVPLSASVFGKKKLSVSPMKTAIEADTKLLHAFGVGLNAEINLGIEPKITKFFRDIAKKVSFGKDKLDNYIPILEYICRKYPNAWLTLSSLYEEEGRIENAITTIQNYLEFIEEDNMKLASWKKLSILYALNKDFNGEIHSLIELAELSITPLELISSSVNKIHILLNTKRFQPDSSEKQILLERIIKIYSLRLNNINGGPSDYSQLAWLHILNNDKSGAKRAVHTGLKMDEEHIHCLKLKETLNIM